MGSIEVQPTVAVTFRGRGDKPVPVHLFVKAGRRWIVASDICRILGIRTDTVTQLVPEPHRSHATVLSKGSVQSVTTITEQGFALLVAQSPKLAAKTLQEWMTAEALPSVLKAPKPKAPATQGELF
ncbi:Bro-N domain-containing protein [Rhodovastum atsumiense]|nr:BRO family protein [Rhodovastum atsumiense]CAH2602823.1 Bro-N domain-containing protein [Rhodovastum atsumiense]